MKNQTDHVPSKPMVADEYVYRRPLRARERAPAIGAGLGAAILTGLAVYYVTKLFLERTPLVPPPRVPGTLTAARRAT